MIAAMLVRRFLVGLLILWLVSLAVFGAVHILPGSAAFTLLGKEATPFSLHELTVQLGLTKPLPVQYWHWISGLFTLNWGTSLTSSLKVSYIVRTRMENTALLAVFTMAIATPLSILIGTYTATRSGRASDNAITLVTLCLSALPGFVIGVLLIYILAANVFHLLPAASIVNPNESILRQLPLTVLPTMTLVLSGISYPIRMVRANMIDVLQSDYVMMARLKGLPERRVVLRHALRNGIAPMIQAFGLNFLHLAAGVVLVETVFSYPGIGLTLVQSVNSRDIPTIQTIVVLLAGIYVTINLLTDLAVIMVTPRLRARL